MSSTNHTQHYGLSQWEPEDAFLREDFNEDHRKIDEAIHAVPAAGFGSYAGLCAEGNHTEQRIVLGFSPRLVLIVPSDGSLGDTSGRKFGGLIAPGCPVYTTNPETGWAARVTETGFVVRNNSNFQLMNRNDKTYYYMAVR